MMLRGIRRRLTYANVVASIALFIALGGVSYAAIKLPKNSVGPRQIKKNAVTGSKIRNNSLTGADVKNGSLTGADVRKSSLTGSDIKDRSLTAADFNGSVQGPAGPPGAAGPAAGPAGGDLAGSYPNPTLRRSAVVQLHEQPKTSCLVTYDILCGNVDSGDYWTRATNASFATPGYSIEPGGYVQFQGAVQQVGAGYSNGASPALLFYLPVGRRPAGTLRFPVVNFDHPDDTGHVRVGDNGEVSLIDLTLAPGTRFDISAVRFRIADPPG